MILLIEPGVAADVPFVFDESISTIASYSSDQIEQASVNSLDLVGVPLISAPSDSEDLEFPITGGSGTPDGEVDKNVGELKSVLDSRIEPDNPTVRHEALLLAGKHPGDYTIEQISAIYSYLKSGDGVKNGWSYVRDPRGVDYFNNASESLGAGKEIGCSGIGDCDDFAILMAALVESIGGTTRIILARNNTTGGHAYAEVYLGNLNASNNQVDDIIHWLKQKFNTNKIYTHIDTDTKDVWLNLDWGTDEEGNVHPGGPFYQGDKHIVLCMRDKYGKTPLKGSSSAMGSAKATEFAFSDWGRYYIIEYFDGIYFAGYADGYLKDRSDFGMLRSNQRSKVLIDNRNTEPLTSSEPLVLEQGYQLSIRSIDRDGNKVQLELSKNGQVVDSKVIQPSIDGATMYDKTYYYKKNLGDTNDIVTIAVHFNNAFRGADEILATVDGVFQISELIITDSSSNNYESIDLEAINASATPKAISDSDKIPPKVLAFKARSLNLTSGEPVIFDYVVSDDGGSRIKQVELWRNNGSDDWQIIKTNMLDVSSYRVSGSFTDAPSIPGKYRYSLNVVDNANNWNYDDIFLANYQLSGQEVNLPITDWGWYHSIIRPDGTYFAGYASGYLKDTSLRNNQIRKVLLSNQEEQTFNSSHPLVLEQGYNLSIRSIDLDGNKVFLELSKNGQVVDSEVISPSRDGATMYDKTYYYKRYLGNSIMGPVIIAVHFKSAFRGADLLYAIIDGVFQVSDEFTQLSDTGSIEVEIK